MRYLVCITTSLKTTMYNEGEKMKIGIFTDAYPPIISGVSTSIATLAKELKKLGHTVIIITFTHPESKDEDDVIRIPGRNLPMKGLKEYSIAKVTRSKVRELEALKLDLVHIHTEFTIGRLGRKFAKKHHIPIVHTYHTMYEDYIHFVTPVFQSILRYVSKVYSKKFANSANEVVFPTIKVKKKFIEYGFKKEANIIPTGIYLERFRKINFKQTDISLLKESIGLRPTDFVLLFLGRLSREKNVEALLEQYKTVMKEYPDVKLVLVGGGPDEEYFKEIVVSNNMQSYVFFVGMVHPDDVPKYYQIGDLFVNFSTTETQGLTYIEALASGCPLLVKYDDNLENVIKNNVNGFSFRVDQQFPKLFKRIYDNKVLLDELTANSSKSINDFAAEKYARSILDIYNKLVYKEE